MEKYRASASWFHHARYIFPLSKFVLYLNSFVFTVTQKMIVCSGYRMTRSETRWNKGMNKQLHLDFGILDTSTPVQMFTKFQLSS